MKLNRTESPLSRAERNKINENWSVIESNYNNFAELITEETYQQIINGSKLEWQEPVDNESGLPSEADEGDTRMVRDTGKVYRYNGTEWQEIQQIDAGPVNELDNRVNTQLAQKADKTYVDGELGNKADKTYVDTELDKKADKTYVDTELGKKADKTYVDGEFEGFNTQLAQNQEQLKLSDLYDKYYGKLTLYNKPPAFPIDFPFNVYTSNSGKVDHNYDVAVNKVPVDKRYYVDVNNGNNNNDGSENAPFETLERAFRYGDADEIILKSGVYDWTRGATGITPNNQKSKFNLIGDGEVYLGAHRGYEDWSQVSNNVFMTSVSSVLEVIDIRDYENPLFYEKVNSVDEVENTPASYYIDGNDVYVRPNYEGQPDDKLLLNMTQSAMTLSDKEHVYIENIKFTNTLTMDNPNIAGNLYIKNSDFNCSTNDNAVSIWGDVTSIFQNCSAMYAERDGFNYHVRNGKLPRAIEVDCIGAYNGRDGGNSNNGSTMHDGGAILRVGGEYHHNDGPNVIDVNDGTTSLNIGVHAHSSIATYTHSNVDFRTRDDADMWLINCVSHDSDFSTSVEGVARLHKENSLLMEEEAVI